MNMNSLVKHIVAEMIIMHRFVAQGINNAHKSAINSNDEYSHYKLVVFTYTSTHKFISFQ